MKNKLPLLQALLDYSKEDNVIFSMPGNKSGKGFLRDKIGEEFKEKMGSLDITEVSPLDNLQNPEGVIKEAQEHLANLYRVKKAYLMVNGSTGGNLTAIFSAFNEGDEILVERNSHKSIHNAIILRKLKVIYIESSAHNRGGLFLPPSKENIYDALDRSNNPKGIILTYPNYYGIAYNLEETIMDLKDRGLKILIDEAHGAHFGITQMLPNNLATLADYTVLSAHKTLPALTGGAYLLVNDKNEDVQFYLNSFITTSPSYLILASLDYARNYLELFGKLDYEKLIKQSEQKKNEINKLGKVKVMSNEDLPTGYQIDKSRYVLSLADGYSGHKLLDYLRSKHIQAEMSFHSGVVLILSPSNFEEGVEKLIAAIKALDMNEIKSDYIISDFKIKTPIKALEPYEVFKLKGKYVMLDEAVGKIAKEAITPYPPGIPIISCGEIIEQDIIERIKIYKKTGTTILGMIDDKVKVVEKDDEI